MRYFLIVVLFILNAAGGYSDWTQSGLSSKSILSLKIDPVTSTTMYAVTSNGVFRSLDSGSSWSANIAASISSSLSDIAIYPTDPSKLLVAASDGIYRSINGGTNWTLTNSVSQITNVIISPKGNVAVAFSNGTYNPDFYRSTDGGANWTVMTSMSMGLTYAFFDSVGSLYGISFHYVGLSLDGGDNFSQISTAGSDGLPAHVDSQSKISMVNNKIFLENRNNTNSNSDGLYLFVPGSAHLSAFWSTLVSPSRGYEVDSVVINPLVQTEIYVATDSGIILTKDGGLTWVSLNAGLTSLSARALINTKDAMYCGTDNGVYKYVFPTAVVVPQLIANLKPVNNLFNPDNGETCTINWSISMDATVTLQIYNLKGELVRTVINAENKTAGPANSYIWDGTDSSGIKVSSGIYLAYLKAGAVKTWKKIAVTR